MNYKGVNFVKINTKDITITALFAALTAAGAFISIPVGPVPITLQILFTMLSAVILGAKLGALSQFVYVILGLVGLPVFAGFTGGISCIIKPSFGYLIGFIAAAYVIGKIAEGGSKEPGFLRLFAACVLGIVIIYLIGVPYMYFIIKNVMTSNISIGKAISTGFLIFVPGDLIKAIVAAFLGYKIIPLLKKAALR